MVYKLSGDLVAICVYAPSHPFRSSLTEEIGGCTIDSSHLFRRIIEPLFQITHGVTICFMFYGVYGVLIDERIPHQEMPQLEMADFVIKQKGLKFFRKLAYEPGVVTNGGNPVNVLGAGPMFVFFVFYEDYFLAKGIVVGSFRDVNAAG